MGVWLELGGEAELELSRAVEGHRGYEGKLL